MRKAATNGDIGYAVADLQAEPLPQESFNLIISYEVLVHCNQPGDVVKNLYQSLSPEGQLFFNADISQKSELDGLLIQLTEARGGVRSAIPKPSSFQKLTDSDAGRVDYIIVK